MRLGLNTFDGAKALHLDGIGSLQKDFKADMIFIDLSRPNMSPNYDIYNTLVYSMNPRDVYRVMVAGKILVDNGRIKDTQSFENLMK